MQRVALVSILVLVILLVSSFIVFETFSRSSESMTLSTTTAQCDPIPGGASARAQLNSTTFGAITEWKLPSEDRSPDAITVAPDGSVWFAEQEVPGVAHLYPNNGTLVEYAWPGYPPPTPPYCLTQASSSGIAIWNGRIWAADEFANALWGVDPGTGSIVRVNATANAAYPYWVAAGPDGNLWFTSDNITQYPSKLGRIYPNLTLSIVNLIGVEKYYEPIEVDFVNSSLAFVTTLSEVENMTTKTCECTGHVYSFDPSDPSTDIPAALVGGNHTIILPASLSYSEGKVWVTEHGASAALSYDFATGTWTCYPTSLVSWTYTTLPYVIDANGSQIWFNEHYADKIANIHASSNTMTEFAESDPPAANASGIQNDVDIALTNTGLWFTSISGNYVGFVNASYVPPISLTPPENDTLYLSPGESSSVTIQVSGSRSSPMVVNVSDSENFASMPELIHITPSVLDIPAGDSTYDLGIQISLAPSTAPGNYTVAVTVTDGLTQQTVFIFVRAE